MSAAIDTLFAYRLLRIVTIPWNKQKAYEVGILDDKGNVLISRHDQTKAQKSIYNAFYRLGINMKRIIEKIPGGKSRIGTYTSALWLLKETLHNDSFDFLIEDAVNVAPGSPGSGIPVEERPLGKKKKKKKKKLLTKNRKTVTMKENKLINLIKDVALVKNDDDLTEKILRVIRGRKKVKLVRPSVRKKGYKSVDGKNVRMKAKEKLARKKGQKRGARKRRVKTKISNIRRAKSMKKVKR